jgi:hypothetical protein
MPRHPPHALHNLTHFEISGWTGARAQALPSTILKQFFKETILERVGGGKRDRTADPVLAKHVLSQLSYAPAFPSAVWCRWRMWWAWADSNCRPRAYQARTLTS